MGCYICKCKLCKKEIKAKDYFEMQIREGDHEENEHPDIFEKNKKATEEFNEEYRKINDIYINSQQNIFTETKWEGEDMTDEEAVERGYVEDVSEKEQARGKGK